MSQRVTVDGLPRIRRTLAAAGREIADMTPANQAAGQALADAGAAAAPRRSGRLASSITVVEATANGVAVGSHLPYARVIHDGWPRRGITARPFLDDEADGPTLLPHYREHVQDALDRVKGI